MDVKLSNFGCSLSSRLKGREVFNSLKPEILLVSDKLILDFEGINGMTLSFCTELFDSINLHTKINDIQVINADDFLKNIINFSRNHLKPLQTC